MIKKKGRATKLVNDGGGGRRSGTSIHFLSDKNKNTFKEYIKGGKSKIDQAKPFSDNSKAKRPVAMGYLGGQDLSSPVFVRIKFGAQGRDKGLPLRTYTVANAQQYATFKSMRPVSK